jgi:hypothetical protein
VENLGSSGNGKWRVFAELLDQEKWSIYEGITKFVATNSGTELLPLEGIRGMTYTLLKEDKGTPLRDAREYSDLLGICGKVQESGVAISVCLGDRFKMLAKAEETVIRYLDIQKRSLRTIFGEKWRIWVDRDMVFMNGEGAVAEIPRRHYDFLESSQFLHGSYCVILQAGACSIVEYDLLN